MNLNVEFIETNSDDIFNAITRHTAKRAVIFTLAVSIDSRLTINSASLFFRFLSQSSVPQSFRFDINSEKVL